MAVIDRANWARTQPLAAAIQRHPRLDLRIVCGGAVPIDRFAVSSSDLEAASEDFTLNEVEGNCPESMARSGALAQFDFAACIRRSEPDIAIVTGDRYQAVAFAMAAITMRIPLLHIQGGEVSGSLDERYRHMLTKAADFHLPATAEAAANLIRMGERPESVIATGCPSSDLARFVVPRPDTPILCQMHPDTSDIGDERQRMTEVLDALDSIQHRTAVWWPNIDAHSDGISKAIRAFGRRPWLTTIKSKPPAEYLSWLAGTPCAVGNSSGFVRDSSYFGSPVVLVGHRQDGRESGPNVLRCECETDEIIRCVQQQLAHGRYPPSDLYGDGRVSERVVEALLRLPLRNVKRLAYADVADEVEQVLA